MSMSKQDFIALADHIKTENSKWKTFDPYTKRVIESLAEFCQQQNPAFKRERWLSYIAGECGPNGGAIKPPKPCKDYEGRIKPWGKCMNCGFDYSWHAEAKQ